MLPLGIAGLVVWSFWLYRAVSSLLGRPVVTDFRTTTLNASNGADNISVLSTNGNRILNVNANGGNDTIRLRMAGVACIEEDERPDAAHQPMMS